MIIIERAYRHVKREFNISKFQKLKHGKACEIEAINGVVCREGRKYGVKTPINDRIVEVVKEIQEGKRKACGENVKLFDDVL